MIKLYLTLFVFSLNVSLGYSQRNFVRHLLESIDYEHQFNPDVRAHPDGGVVIAIPVKDGALNSILLVKMDVCSNIEWSKIFTILHGTYNRSTSYYDLDVSGNGDILIFGSRHFDRISSKGEILFSREFRVYGGVQTILKIRDISKGKRMVVYSDDLMVIFDQNGDLLYAEYLASARQKAEVLNLKEDSYIVAHGPVIYKRNSDHKLVWKFISDTEGLEFHRLVETANGIVGTFSRIVNHREVFYLFGMNHLGEILWTSKGFLGWVRHIMINNKNQIVAAAHIENQYTKLAFHVFDQFGEYHKSVFTDSIGRINSVRSSENYIYSIGDGYGSILAKFNANLESESCLLPYTLELLDTVKVNLKVHWDSSFVEAESFESFLSSVDHPLSYDVLCEQEYFVSINQGMNQDTILCFQDTFQLESTHTLPQYKWSTGSDSASTLVTEPGTYWLEAGDKCETQTDTFKVEYYPDPELAYRINPMSGDIYTEFKFISLTPDPNDLQWDLGDSTLKTNKLFWHSYKENGLYPVTYSFRDSFNCYFSDVSYVKVNLLSIQIPNTVTPNNDGLNDSFKPLGYGFKSYNMTIYDRWGGIIFRGDNSEWYPGTAPQGMYLYDIRFIDDFGVGEERKGTLMLLR